MADRYWVGGTANWDGTAGTKWATTSGGAGGAAVPTSSDDVYFDAASGAVTVTVATVTFQCRNLNFTGFTGTFAGSTSGVISGNLTLGSSMTRTHTGAITFNGASANTITCNGVALGGSLVFNNATGSWTLVDDLVTGATRSVSLTSGSLDLNGNNLTFGAFISNNANVRSLLLGGGSLNAATNFTATNATNFTISGGGVINMTGAATKTFDGGGATYPTLNQGGAGALVIVGANTFANITNTVQPSTITFPASATTTVSNFSLSGSPAGQLTINSSTGGTQATLRGLDSRVSVSYVSIQDIAAIGVSEWNADTSQGVVDLGNNTGWNFITLGLKRVFRRIFGRQIIRPVFSN